MKHRLLFYVHPRDEAKCLEEVTIKGGTLSTIQPDDEDSHHFIAHEAYFDNLNQVNHFIYSCFSSIGLFFYVKRLEYVKIAF